jgi:acyl dehydratase
MIMRIFNGFEDIKSAVGTEVGVSEWFEITQDRIDKFAEATCDEQWRNWNCPAARR